MNIITLWMMVIAGLFCVAFCLAGADYGVGIWSLLLGREDVERRVMLNVIGPFWLGNEVWLVLAVAALFAAFPHWYASIFSALYVPLVVLLLALILLGVAPEFRSQDEGRLWRTLWDGAFFVGGLLSAFIWGLFLGNLSHGIPLGQDRSFDGPFWQLLHPQALVGGLSLTLLFAFQGLLLLNLKTHGPLQKRAAGLIRKVWWPALLAANGFTAWNIVDSQIFAPITVAGVVLALILISFLFTLCRHFLDQEQPMRALVTSALVIALTTLPVFAILHLQGLKSTLDPIWTVTAQVAASGAYSLQVSAIIAAIGIPLVILYQIWAYRILRGRVGVQDTLEY
ncbi:MAG: cytochrome d ubiquinol oxidase subunit II [Anaerolineae bacterium]|nr:cytochrome d ubiquinol oxidase subunit II [Anaerolineae bacterium]